MPTTGRVELEVERAGTWLRFVCLTLDGPVVSGFITPPPMKAASCLVIPILLIAQALSPAAEGDVAAVRAQAAQWRSERRTIDMHMHIGPAGGCACACRWSAGGAD